MFVFDATPLIYLAKADKLEEVEALERKKVIPEKVYEEVVTEGRERGEPDAKKIDKLVRDGVFEVGESGKNNTEDAKFLSEADLSVLELAKQKNATAVMDEEYGRNIAEVEGIQTRGTEFIILKLLKKDILTGEEAKETVDRIIEEGWYCSTSLYKEIIDKIERVD